jgi:para-aminobenzoate synthetase/4-amino-4-deoxychorismate lyase
LLDRRRDLLEYGVGGGIVWDSGEDREYAECVTKASVLTHAMPEFDLLETLAWSLEEGFRVLGRHLDRLAASARYFARPLDLKAVRARLRDSVCEFRDGMYRVRLLVDRQGGIRVETYAMEDRGLVSYRLGWAENPVDLSNCFLYHKTTHRELYDQALSGQPDCDDVLLWNERGEVTESCRANIVIERDETWLTPPVSCGLLPGTWREHMMDQGVLQEAVLTRDDVVQADQVFLVNSVRGMWRVIPRCSTHL